MSHAILRSPGLIGHEARRTWPAALTIEVQSESGRSRLTQVCHRGPLRIQRPFYPEGPGLAHVYVLHPPAGLVAGDTLDLSIRLGPDAAALFTAPGATKAYRSAGGEACVNQHYVVPAGASLESLPHEIIVFDAARLRQTTTIDLATDARYLGWETLCLGRPESGRAFESGLCDLRVDIRREGRWLLRERQCWGETARRYQTGYIAMGSHPYYSSLYAYPGNVRLLEALREGLGTVGLRMAATLIDGLLVLRLLASDLPSSRSALVQAWRILRPLWAGRPACPPRIWST